MYDDYLLFKDVAITCSRPVKNRINMYTKISINLLEEEKFNNLKINDRTRVLHISYYWVYITWLNHVLFVPETSQIRLQPINSF